MQKSLKSKEEVQKAFQVLLEAHQKDKIRIATKEEQAQQEQNKKLVEAVAGYSPQSIVKGLADLQLDLGNTIESLSDRLSGEIQKLDDLRSAIKVQEENLKESVDTKTAANALYILQKEQAQQLEILDKEHLDALKKLEEEAQELRSEWEKEQEEFERDQTEYSEQLEKDRINELEEYKYQLERKYMIEKDNYAKKKKLLLRNLNEEQKEKEKDWANREKILAENQEDFEKYKTKVDNFDQELEEKVKAAREKAIKQASRDSKEAMQLLEKEVEGKRKAAEANIQNMDTTIDRQKLEIEALNAELKEALSQVQSLSLKALESSASKAKLN
ncbi:MAG: hypothetical protein GY810_03435 [Aureispira sp.]|nr:hypothetical protein [Aureispira sp.]